MRTIFFQFVLAVLGLAGVAAGTTYYVSSSQGNDANSGTSTAAPWKTIGHVNGQTLQAGDSVLFRRGDVWNESLVPPASGSSGNPIAFDAYGTGAAPNLTGYYAVQATGWVLVTGNTWKARLPDTYTTVNFCLFGSVWGQKVPAASSNLAAQWDFYLANGYLYVYSVGNPATYYNQPIVPMALSNVPVINVNGQSWLTFQHLLVNWFDQYGVYVQGASDHLVFANMEADSMIPQGAQPLGFYVSESAPGPGDIKIYNSGAHLNYDGFRFDGAATAITMANDNAYANRDGALVDNLTYIATINGVPTTVDDTAAVIYSSCHFYASSLAVAGSTDVEWPAGLTGPVAGAGNIPADTPAAVQVWQRYPARVTLTVDDAGMTPGADTYYANTVWPIAEAAGVEVGAAITVGYPLAQTQTLISEFQSWINAGRDVTAHSISHTYYTNTDALDIQYTGSGTAAALSISNQVLTIAVTGASDSVSYNLGLSAGQTVGTGIQTMVGLQTALNNTGKFTANLSPLPCQGPYGTGCSAYTGNALLTQDLADVSGVDVKGSLYHMQLDVTRLTTDEITLARRWMTTNLTGLPTSPVYVYPGGYEDPNMEAIAAGVPYTGARGALHEGGTANNGQPVAGANDTYANGFNAQDITSFGVNPSWMGLTPASLKQKVQELVWKEMVWGVPWGIFWHWNATAQAGELSATEITNLIADLQASGATIQKNTDLVNWLTGGTLEAGTDGNYYYKSPAASMALDFRPTVTSPVVDAGQNLGAAYEIDLDGINQNSYGSRWEIGAHVFIPAAIYGMTNAATGAHFLIGENGTACGPPDYCAYAGQDIIQWPSTVPNVGTYAKTGTAVYDTSYVAHGESASNLAPIMRCTDTNTSPGQPTNMSYTAGEGGATGILFNTNSTLMHISGDSGEMILFNPATMACGDSSGRAITQDHNLTNPGSSSLTQLFGNGQFSLTDPTVWYQADSALNGAAASQYVKYTFNTSTGDFTVGPVLADFIYGAPINGNGGVAEWQANTSYPFGAYIYHTMGTSEYYDWAASSSSFILGDLIVPSAGNSAGCAYKLIATGTTGATHPNWPSTCSSPTPIADGTAAWHPLTGPPVFIFQLTSGGQTINAASCSASDVQTALNSVAAEGTTVVITACPAGVSWTTSVVYNQVYSTTILGQGSPTGYNAQGSPTGYNDQTVFIDNVGDTGGCSSSPAASSDCTISVVTAAGKSFRMSGITVTAGTHTANNAVVVISGSSQAARIDHNHFVNLGTAEALVDGDHLFGVFDHNQFEMTGANQGIWFHSTNWNGDSNGDGSWNDSTYLGTNKFFFAENNTFNGTSGNGSGDNDCTHGGRFVWRYNTMNNNTAMQTHPTGGSGRQRGCRAWEAYGNDLVGSNSTPQYNGYFLSSGTGVFWGNSAPAGYEQLISAHNVRSDTSDYTQTPCTSSSNCAAGWGYCGNAVTGQTFDSLWDQNNNPASGYACLDQPGRGIGDLLTGNFPNVCDATSGQCAIPNYKGTWANDALEPVYEWMDTFTPVPGYCSPTPANSDCVLTVAEGASAITKNQDYYVWCNASAPTGCTTFNGTAGVGSGVLASRPGTCTAGVAYWATDQGSWNQSGSGGQGQLYLCTATNTWTLSYTPYTYPHPLESAGGSGCISGSSAPAFVPARGHPDQFTTVTDNTCTWTNVNPNVPFNWEDAHTVDRTGTKFGVGASSTFYGLAGLYQADAGDQNTGIWDMTYDSVTNRYHLFNTATGIMSDVICTGGTGYNCAGGTRSWMTLGLPTAMSNCHFSLHAGITTQNGQYQIAGGTTQAAAGCPNNAALVWQPTQTPFNAATQAQWTPWGFNHTAVLDHSVVDLNSATYGTSSGVYNVFYPMSNITANPSITWEVNPCSTTPNSNGQYIPPACSHSVVDNHIDGSYNPGGADNYPVCGTVYNYATLSPVEFSAWQGEVMCQTTTPMWNSPSSPSTQQKQWRFSHIFNTGTNSTFSVQFAISQVAQDGRFIAFSSDWNSQLGSTTGSAPTLPVSNPSVTCLGGLPWQPSTAYATGALIHPIQGTSGGGTIYHVFQAISGGTSGSGNQPSGFAGSTLGTQITDNTVNWQDLGPGNCRGDVFVVKAY